MRGEVLRGGGWKARGAVLVGARRAHLGEVGDALLGDDEVGLHGDDLVADRLDVVLLLAEQLLPRLVVRELDVRLRNPAGRRR